MTVPSSELQPLSTPAMPSRSRPFHIETRGESWYASSTRPTVPSAR